LKVLLTGAAGFIGMHVARMLLDRGEDVMGIDNLNDYYDPSLKFARLRELAKYKNFKFAKVDLAENSALEKIFKEFLPQKVIHLAAQAGVRYSIKNPHVYIQSNIVGFCNILEGCRNHDVQHLVYASSSSVYGLNKKAPFSVNNAADHPVSLYAATKKANELMAHTYSHLYGLPTTGLRYFTVYGPWGRPDMALWLFTEAILNGAPINVYNNGLMRRDFTYVDDIAVGTLSVLDSNAAPMKGFDALIPTLGSSNAPYKIYNIGNNKPVSLLDFIFELEKSLGKTAIKNMLPMQPGDLIETYADIDSIVKDTGFRSGTSLNVGLPKWTDWYLNYHRNK